MKLEEMMNTEKNDVKKILDRHSIKNIDDIEYGSDVYDELFDYFSNSGEMPYGVMKARTGMPDEWIADRINDLEILEESDIDIRKLLLDISSMKNRIGELPISDDAKTSALTALGQVEEDIAQEIKEPFPEADEITVEDDQNFYEEFGWLGYPTDELWEAEYRGRKVKLNKPMRGDVKKFKVYVKDPKTGNVKKVNFGHGGTSAKKLGQKTMKIKKNIPSRRKSFRARHNCENPGPKTKARYWSCRAW
jgi:hypothetical protein